MAHEIETIAYYGARPWHGLGIEVLGLMTAQEALVKGGLDWEVEKRKLFADVEGNMVHVPNHFATVRTKDNRPLGVVGNTYQVVQNVDALDFIDALTASGEAKYETVGSLQMGKIVWVMAKVPNVDGVDPVEPYLLCTTSHDGSSPVKVTATRVRVVCNNTLNAALQSSRNTFRIRHTTNVESKIEEARKTLAESLKYFHIAAEVDEKMKNEKFTEEQLAKTVLKVFKGTEDVGDMSDRQVRSYDGILEDIIALTQRGMGVDLPGVKGTAWGAYNALTEFLDHQTAVKGGKGRRAEEVLMESIWFGTVADKNQVALDTILEMVKIAA